MGVPDFLEKACFSKMQKSSFFGEILEKGKTKIEKINPLIIWKKLQSGDQLSTYKADKLSNSNLRNLVSTGNPRITTSHKLPKLKKVQNLDKDQVRMKPLEDSDDNVIVVVLF